MVKIRSEVQVELPPSTVTYNAVIDACSAGNWEACHQVSQLGLGFRRYILTVLSFYAEMWQDGFYHTQIVKDIVKSKGKSTDMKG